MERGFKYGSQGLHSKETLRELELPEEMREALANLLNHSLTAGTWSTYRTVGNQLERCQVDTGVEMNFPLDTRNVLVFVHWLFYTRKVTASTVNSYLSGLRYLHILKGVEIPVLRPPIIEGLVKGKHNLENIENRQSGKTKRAPITMNVMKLLKIEIKNWDNSRENKALLWTVCTLAFAGCLRIHEILCKKRGSYDPEFTLLGSDVVIKPLDHHGERSSTIQVLLKSPKEDRIGRGKIIDVYQNGGPICPVRAMQRWLRLRTFSEGTAPMFRFEDGSCLTGRELNCLLKQFLGKHLDYEQGRFSSHSFRAGMATLLGTLGFRDEDIKALGRWSSSAYLEYLKLPRTRRVEMARRVGDAMR